ATRCACRRYRPCSIRPSAKRPSARSPTISTAWARRGPQKRSPGARARRRAGGAEEAPRRIAATMACHAAVKANYPLTLDKMRYILEELRRTAYSSVCPHGRPVVLRLTRREIEKNFQRI